MIFYTLINLRSDESPYLGARFIEECAYIESFMHDDQIGMIQQYAYVQHMKTALGIILRGEAACVAYFIEEPEEGEENDVDFSPVDFVIVPKMTPKLVKEKSTGFDILSKLKEEGLFRSSTTVNNRSSFFDDEENEEDMFSQSRGQEQRQAEKYTKFCEKNNRILVRPTMSTTSTINTSNGGSTLGTTSSTVLQKDNGLKQKQSILASVAEESGPQVEEADEGLLEKDHQTMKKIRQYHSNSAKEDMVASPTSPQNIMMQSQGYQPSKLSQQQLDISYELVTSTAEQ